MGDAILKAAGIACAAGSVWFAAHMVTHQDGGPRINAMQDFAIFAQPNRLQAVEAAVSAATASNASLPKRPISIDMTPVGATSPGAAERPRRGPADELRIVELNEDDALLETPTGFRRVRVGDDSPEMGKIISIRKLADYWIVVAGDRSIAQRAPAVEARDAGGAKQRPAGASLGQD